MEQLPPYLRTPLVTVSPTPPTCTEYPGYAHIATDNISLCSYFFFQAEDGIRDYKVTGVQTCALPISKILIVSLGLAVGRLEFFAEMAAAGLAAVQGVHAKQLGKFHEIGHPARVFERDRKSVV